MHGFLGPNGAGKSTTLRVLLGLMRADGGDGAAVRPRSLAGRAGSHRRLAYVPGDVALWPNLSGGETVDLLLRMRGADPAPSRKAELVERFRLDLTTKARAYSRGNRQKVALVAALARDTELLVLDEPTSGLDPLMEQVFRECIAEHRARGATVLLSSHILGEVERLADRVTIIRDGRTVETGSLAEPAADAARRPATPAWRSSSWRRTDDVVGRDGPAAAPGPAPRPGARAGLAGGPRADGLRVGERHRDRCSARSRSGCAVATSFNEQPGLLALYGPILDPRSAGELAMSKLTVLYALFSAVLYVVLVRRHTRVEEETGPSRAGGRDRDRP